MATAATPPRATNHRANPTTRSLRLCPLPPCPSSTSGGRDPLVTAADQRIPGTGPAARMTRNDRSTTPPLNRGSCHSIASSTTSSKQQRRDLHVLLRLAVARLDGAVVAGRADLPQRVQA